MDPIQVSEWMFDANFERSSLYSTLLQVLRIFGEHIRTVSDDLDSLSSLLLNPANGLPFRDQEIKSLRDGLFSATSLREANRSATMNHYVIIFTVVTVLFLPPTFTPTVFALDFFKKSDPRQTAWEFKVTTVVISLVTYITAGLCVIAVNWKHIKARILSSLRETHEETEVGDGKRSGVAGVELDDASSVIETGSESGSDELRKRWPGSG
ncbi:hypothetical protein F5Y09DRAFT_341723 [Xylaria sp. FL1042]|nr:hypothetical protein F5Y09DRAFT_341723 [Xylaria sp. FL1042]